MSNQKIPMKTLTIFVFSCMISAILLNIVNLYYGFLSKDVETNFMLFTVFYVAVLLVLMGIHKSNSISDDYYELIDEDNQHAIMNNLATNYLLIKLGKSYKSKLLNQETDQH